MNKIYVIEKYGNTEYLSMDALGNKYGLSKQVIRKRVREIETEIGNRYSRNAVITDGKIVLINVFVFLDWLSNRKLLKDSNAKKYVKPFNAAEWAAYMGYYQTIRKEDEESEEGDKKNT